MSARILAVFLGLAMVATVSVPAPAVGQWSVDIPGVPRASIVRQGGAQGRFELEGSWLSPGGAAGDSTVLATRLGAGWSWRIASALEFGFDFSLASGQRITGIADPGADEDAAELRLTGGYGLRFGLKFRPISYVDLDGNGIEVAVGVGYQPELEPVVRYENDGDSSYVAGLVGDDDDPEAPRVHSSTLFMGAVSYRDPRLMGDLAIVSESPAELENPFLRAHSGLVVKAGLRYRLTHGFSVGASYWGSGAPPWRDRPALALASESDSQFGFLLSFGGTPEKSTDLMVSSPTGSFGESVTVYISVR